MKALAYFQRTGKPLFNVAVSVCAMFATSTHADEMTAPKRVVFVGWSFAATQTEFDALKLRVTRAASAPKPINVQLELATAVPADYDDLEMVVHRVIKSNPDVIAAVSSGISVEIKRQTNKIPIVFSVSIDPRDIGLTANLAKPNSNATGLSTLDLGHGRRLQLFGWAYPTMRSIGVIVDPTFIAGGTRSESEDIAAFGRETGLRIEFVKVETEAEVVRAIRGKSFRTIDGWYFPNSFAITNLRSTILKEVKASGVPAIFANRDAVLAGGALAYAWPIQRRAEKMAKLIDRVLRGIPLRDSPIEQIDEYQLVANADVLQCVKSPITARVAKLVDEYVVSRLALPCGNARSQRKSIN